MTKKANSADTSIFDVDEMSLDLSDLGDIITDIDEPIDGDGKEEDMTVVDEEATDDKMETFDADSDMTFDKEHSIMGADMGMDLVSATPPPIVSGISSFITDIDDKAEFLTWCIYGKNGTGKTTLLSTTPGTLILAVEDGTLSIRDKVIRGDAKKIIIDTWDKVEQIYWLLNKGEKHINPVTGKCEGILIPTAKGKFLVKTVAFDTVSRLAQTCLRNVILGEKEKDTSRDILKPTQSDWGKMTQRMTYWLSMFKQLPLQNIWLCQERSNTEDIESEEAYIFPDLSQALRSYVCSDADIIGRTYIKNVGATPQFRIIFGNNEKAVTKDRTNKLGKIIANPNLSNLYKKVFEED